MLCFWIVFEGFDCCLTSVLIVCDLVVLTLWFVFCFNCVWLACVVCFGVLTTCVVCWVVCFGGY